MRLSSPSLCEGKKEYPTAGYTLAHNTLAVPFDAFGRLACYLLSLLCFCDLHLRVCLLLFFFFLVLCSVMIVPSCHGLRLTSTPLLYPIETTLVHTPRLVPGAVPRTKWDKCLKSDWDPALYEKPDVASKTLEVMRKLRGTFLVSLSCLGLQPCHYLSLLLILCLVDTPASAKSVLRVVWWWVEDGKHVAKRSWTMTRGGFSSGQITGMLHGFGRVGSRRERRKLYG